MRAELMPFADAVRGLLAGDFTRLAPLFEPAPDGSPCQVIAWHDSGRFRGEPAALAEAFTCACFLGRTDAMEHLLARGADPSGGAAPGLNAFHWASNRGHLGAVRLLLAHGAPLESRNSYGGTVLGGTVWAAVHEPRATHAAIVEALLAAGARVDEATFPSGDDRIDEVLRRYGVGS